MKTPPPPPAMRRPLVFAATALGLAGCGATPATVSTSQPATTAPTIPATIEDCWEVNVSDRAEYPDWDPGVVWVPVCGMPGDRANRAAQGEIQRDTRPTE